VAVTFLFSIEGGHFNASMGDGNEKQIFMPRLGKLRKMGRPIPGCK
jgi:hypothetical protein